ncbi:preprotein translocase subunit YajC [Actinomyces qiguomingii]|uniref:preprotein translocase subunit YajC n=1 Tax=Actinomyces qiguomingii TaxID=2057800 RepID=UPI000CA06CC1|nr:preprotein translocase subunit YajC [Actinomyces qiguomingii]
MDPMLLMLIIMLLVFWLMSRFARRQQQRMMDEQKRRTEEALVPGTWVRTRAGFYGTVVEVDGEVVTLATPLGDESLWATSAIVGAEEPPFASADEDATEADEQTGAEPDGAAPQIEHVQDSASPQEAPEGPSESQPQA